MYAKSGKWLSTIGTEGQSEWNKVRQLNYFTMTTHAIDLIELD
jgi:hypothetical protein